MLFRTGFSAYLMHYIPLLSARATAPSPKASTELICHTNHASECYPQTFQPTEKFETVHDDQHLPPGLHVRMNLATGVKEARLNVPVSGENDISSGLTLIENSDLLGYESAKSEDPRIHHQDGQSQQPIRAPPHNVNESSLFSDSINEVKNQSSANTDRLLTALADLEDLSHSYHWGLTLAKDVDSIHRLFQLLLPSQLSLEVRSSAALVFGTAIHNNLAALSAALSQFYTNEWPEGPLQAVILALLHEQAPILLNRMMFLLSALCQDEDQLKQFLEAGGLEIVIRIYALGSAGADDNYKLKVKVTHFLVDRLRRPTSENADNNEVEELDASEVDMEWTIVRLRQLRDSNR
ncbi:MAG: hypothetical protein Q9225_002502 [Loekoesia sp. 1 TL-2023]